MKKLVFCLIGMVGYLIAAVTSAHSQEPHEPQQHHHQDYADQKNPVPLTGQSVAKGRKAYSKNCSSCHGDSGKGGIGPDLTDKVWIHGNSDGEIFNIISDGVPGTAMRGFSKELSLEASWHLVNYIKSLGKIHSK